MRRPEVVVAAFLIVVATALPLLGLPTWIVLIAAAVPWCWYLASRVGTFVGIAGMVIIELWALLMVMMATTVTHLPLLPTVTILWGLLGLAGVALVARRPRASRPGAAALATWLPAAAGGLVFLGAMAVSNVVPNAARLAWVMLGDSANNIIFAREIIYRGGVGIGAGENPVPLPSALMAIVMSAGRGEVAPRDYLSHDIGAFAQVWMLLIALTCLLAGALVASLVRSRDARPLTIGLAGAAGSLLPLSWFFTGYPIEFGFFNTHVALPIVFAAFLVYLAADRFPAVALGILTLAATLLLAVWSPLVLMPAALGAVVVARRWRATFASRGGQLVVLALGVAQLLGYGILVVLPSLVRNSAFLSAPGGAFGFHKWMMFALAVVAIAVAVVAYRKLRNAVVLGVVAIVIGSALGLGALLFLTRNEANPWSYYPLKFSWLASTVLLVLAFGLAVAAAQSLFRREVMRIAGLAVVAAVTVAFLTWTPSSAPGYAWKDPIPRILSGDVLGVGDRGAMEIFALADPEQSTFFWHSDDPLEGVKNFWVLQMWSDSMSKNLDLKYAAYGLYDPDDINDLCRIVGLMGGGTIVHTALTDLDQQLDTACPQQDVTVVVTP
ncbi:MAG: hypothetical protein ABJB03_00225 [Rhodoglobus sp.]